MGGRGSASGKQSGRGGQPKQTPTNARIIENMNEAQLNSEIAIAKRQIKSAEKTMGKNDITNTEANRAMSEAFPLGVGGDGWSAERRRAFDRRMAADAKMAQRYTDAYKRREEAQTRLNNLERARREIQGTGKTQRQLRDERKAAEVKNTAATMKWKTTSKGSFDGTTYSPKVMQAGNYEIRGTSGFYRVYVGHGRDAKQIWQSSKLSEAKAYAEKHKKRQG